MANRYRYQAGKIYVLAGGQLFVPCKSEFGWQQLDQAHPTGIHANDYSATVATMVVCRRYPRNYRRLHLLVYFQPKQKDKRAAGRDRNRAGHQLFCHQLVRTANSR